MTEEETAKSMKKIFWLITEDSYEKLRLIEGCETLFDLKATVTDGKHMLALADAVGVQDEYRFIDISPTLKDLKANYLKILKLCKMFSLEGEPHLLIVYVGGHGATMDEKQVYLLNDSDAKKAQFHIEFKLRYIANDPTSITRIKAVFDCCRINLNSMAGLANARGKTEGAMEDIDSEGENDEEPCKYF